LTWFLVRRHTSADRLSLAAAAVVVVTPALLDVSAHAWSETLFCVCVLVFIVTLEEALARPANQVRLCAFAGLLAGLGFLVRYAGLSLVVVGVVAIIVGGLRGWFVQRAACLTVFMLAAVPLPAAWILRNATSSAPYLMGPRVGVNLGPLALLEKFSDGLVALIAPAATRWVWLVGLAPLVGAVTIGVVVATRERTARQPWVGRHSPAPLVIFVCVYGSFVLVAGKVAGASVDTRTVMPIFIPSVVIVAWLVAETLRASSRGGRSSRRLVETVTGIGLVWLLCAGIWFGWTAWRTGEHPRGLAARVGTPSGLAARVRSLDSSVLVSTNKPWTLYGQTGHQPIVPSPGPLYPSVSLVPPTRDALADAACSRRVFYAWYGDASLVPGFVPSFGKKLTLQPVGTFDDGGLFLVRPGPGECANAH